MEKDRIERFLDWLTAKLRRLDAWLDKWIVILSREQAYHEIAKDTKKLKH